MALVSATLVGPAEFVKIAHVLAIVTLRVEVFVEKILCAIVILGSLVKIVT